jgi:hypothetical protein
VSDFLGAIVGGVSNFFGAKAAAAGAENAARITGQYNLRATQAIVDAQNQARAEMRAASQRGLTDIDTGTGKYETTVAPLLVPHPILAPTFRGLTPQQELGLEDLRRQEGATLNASGLRGAGRAGVAAALDQERRYITSARGANDQDQLSETRAAQGRADTARSNLAAIYPQTGVAKANTELLTGTQIGNSFQQQGNATANLAQNTGSAYANASRSAGDAYGNALTSTGNLVGQSIGNFLSGTNSPNDQSYQPPLGGNSTLERDVTMQEA